MFAAAAVAGWILFLVLRTFVPETDGGTIPWTPIMTSSSFVVVMGLLCVFPSVISFVLMNKYQTDLTGTQAAVIYTTEPVFVTLVAMFMPGMISLLGVIAYENETLAVEQVVGGGLILLANVLALWPDSSRRAKASDENVV